MHEGRQSAGVVSHTFTGHHRPGLKAVVTRTLEPADDISARAVAAGIANVTLISVCIEETYMSVRLRLGH